MTLAHYSRLAVASTALNLPWMASFGWCIWVIRSNPGPVAGEIFLLPGFLFIMLGIPAGICGVAALVNIQSSAGSLRGLWIAIVGIMISSLIPLRGLADVIRDAIR